MRKISIAMTTILMAVLMCLSTLLGCGLVTTNYDRDMKQVVATVQIDTSAPKKVIYKKDLIAAYINHNSSSSDHNHDAEENIFEEIVDELINDAVFVQYAMKYFAENTNELDNDGVAITADNKWKIETYLNAEEKLDAKFYAHQDINNLLDGYLDEEEKVGDTYSGAVRATPTGATNDTEKSKEQKEEYINLDANNPNGVIDVSNRRQAFAKLVNMLEENDFLGDGYENGHLETTEYFNMVLDSYQESTLLEKFEIAVQKKARETISYADVAERYAELYNEQVNYTKTEFETALGSLTATTPILYGREGYGTVYHVLLKATDKMTEELTEWKEDNNKTSGAYQNADYSQKRAELFKDITAKEQRESWINLGYDFNGTSFTGDYTLCEDASLPFYGTVTHLNAVDSGDFDYRAKYRVDTVQEFSLKEILALINEYLYNDTANIPTDLGAIDSVTYTATQTNPNFNERLRELMFAFSTDDSTTALNTYKGYVIKPQPDADEKDEWMLEFAEEGRALIGQDQKTFKVVATDYGYHIMFAGENFNPATYNFPTIEAFLNYQYGQDKVSWEDEYNTIMRDWEDYEDTDNYLYVLINNLSSSFVTNSFTAIEQEVIREYVSNSNVVTKNPNAYKDLME